MDGRKLLAFTNRTFGTVAALARWYDRHA